MTRKSSVSNRASTLALAIALVVGPSPAVAQSFAGTGSFTTNGGGAADITPGAQTTTITLNPGQTVIDWVPDDDAIAPGVAIPFQPANTTATFISTDDFAVLNRVNVTDTSRLISLNGTINSIVGELTGGSVFFYSPAGFVLGANAVIDVGSLVLTSSPITVDPDTDQFIDANGTVEFGQALSGSGIYTNAGSNISALNQSSYVAMVAPRVNHSGTVAVNGSAALVGAEAATITFRPNGLFDIEVDVGTTDAGGVGIDGTVTGPASSGTGDYHRIYAVAVPKNSALTLAIGGGANLGFEIAGAADVVGNAVVLSAGHDIINGDTSSAPSSASGADADISIAETNFTSALYARADGDVFASAVDQTIAFASDVSFRARDHAKLEANGTGVVTVDGNLTMSANRNAATDGQSITAGNVTLQAFAGGTVTVNGTTDLSAIGTGGYSDTPGLATGDGTGGIILVQATTDGDLLLGGSLYADVTGSGGSFVGDIDGGNGFGGTINLYASGGGTVSVAGGTYLTADGQAGFPIECIGCGGVGGVGDAGTINVQAHSGPGSSIEFGDVLYIWANGYGGFGQEAGTGIGGNVAFSASDESLVSAAGDVSIEAEGRGGDAFGDGNAGGTGRGGFVETFADNGGMLELSAGLSESADGTGGDSEAGDGGIGRGGTAGVRAATGGSIDLTGPASVTAGGQGGSGLNGGNGTGGIAYVSAVVGTVHAFGNVTVSANSVGGDANASGGTGGSGLADIESVITPVMTEASLFSSGGTLIIAGLATVAANATGGDGGSDGGNGGSAVAAGVAGVIEGGAIIHAANNDDGPSIIRLANVIVTANAQGGQGGDGQGGTDGGDGGDGGSATGGKAVVTAAAGSGDIIAGATQVSALASGGTGGTGGNGDGGDGGNGGDGGTATGGFINVGSESGNVDFAQATNDGTAVYTSISAITNATAGDGGAGGFGNVSGIGGDGGDAFGGNSVLLVRGSEVTVGDVNLEASAFGGDGGLSPNAPDGDGGDATAGVIAVVVTNRFNLPAQRATLTAGDVTGTAIATGGSGGSGDGLSLSVGGNQFVVRRSDATFDSVSLVTTADSFDGNSDFASSSPIEIQNGTVSVTGQFTFETPGSVSMWNDGGTLNAAQITVDADNFIHDEFLPAPLALGTFAANSIALTTGQDLVVDGHLVSVNSVAFNAPGLIDIDNVSSSSGNLTLTAVESITTGGLVSVGTVDVDGSALDLGDVTGGTVILTSNVGDVSAIDIIAFGGLTIDSADDLLFGSIDAPQVDLDAPGSIIGGNITSDSDITAIAGGDIDVGDLSAGTQSIEGFSPGSVALTAGGFVNTGTIDALGSVSIDAATEIETGAIDALTFVQLLAGGDVLTGAILAGSTIDIFTTLGDITTGNLTGTLIDLESEGGDIIFADADSDELIFDAGGSVTGGNIVATSHVVGEAAGAVSLGSISVGPGLPADEDFSVGIASATSINVGDVDAAGNVGFATFGDLTTGDIAAGDLIMALVGGDVTVGGLNTGGEFGEIYIGDAQMYVDAGGTQDSFDPSLVLAQHPVQTGGSITFNGPVSTSLLRAAAGGLAAINDVISVQSMFLTSDDIEIGASGGIEALSVALVSSNATQTIIGDDVPGDGYVLSNAEYGRIDSSAIFVGVDAALGANPSMLIGNLDGVGGNANEFGFATYDGDSEDGLTGSIRVVGEVLFTGMTEDDEVSFMTRTFQLDAETGLLSLTGAGNELAGTLELDANHIHVASAEILDQLADDLQYDGYQDDLNAPAEIERPDGVIRAAVINIEIGNAGEEDLYTLFVQNTGTDELPAGFVASEQILFGEDDEFFLPPGSLDLVINGQIVTPDGVLTGVDVRDALVEAQGDLTPFTENSTVNGCLLNGACEPVEPPEPPEPPVPPDFQPAPGIQAEIVLATDNELPPPEFGNEDFIDDNDEETEDDSPIEPPAPLFDTSQMGEEAKSTNVEVGTSMRSTPGLKSPDDVDDPISGSGNPALMETPPVPQEEKQQ